MLKYRSILGHERTPVTCNEVLPKVAKVYPASGRRSSKRVPVEDLGNNRHPSPSLHVIKGDLVGPGGWCVINDPQTVLGMGSVSIPSMFLSLQFPTMEKLGVKSFARTPGAFGSYFDVTF